MPKAKDKTKRRRVEELEDDGSSQSQRSGRSSQRNEEEDDNDNIDCTQTGKSQKSQKELSKDELNRKVSEWVRYLLFMDRKKYPIKRADISKNVLKEHAKAFNQVFDHAKKNLQKVFGIDLVEIEVGKSKGYILINHDKSGAHGDLVDWGDDLPKMGLLMVILSLIITSDHVITESLLWHTLKKLGIEQKTEHEVFGDVDKLISQEFVRQCYLDRKKVIGGEETAYEYRWGQRAEKELSKKRLGLFVSEIYGTEVESWTPQMREIFNDEEQAVNGVE